MSGRRSFFVKEYIRYVLVFTLFNKYYESKDPRVPTICGGGCA